MLKAYELDIDSMDDLDVAPYIVLSYKEILHDGTKKNSIKFSDGANNETWIPKKCLRFNMKYKTIYVAQWFYSRYLSNTEF